MKIDVLGVGFDDINIGQAVILACDIMKGGEKSYVVTPNPEIVWICRRNEALRSAVEGARLVLPDGIGIILGARILGRPLKSGRVPGIDFVTALFREMAESGGSVFLFGAKPGYADEAGVWLAQAFPGLVIAGTADGYFTDSDDIIRKINAASPDLLLVCLGAPKQEIWMAENIGRLNVPLCAGLGGAIDVYSGRVKRAPPVFQKLGLEWFYRIVREPRRLVRSLKLPLFVLLVIWKRVSTRRTKHKARSTKHK